MQFCSSYNPCTQLLQFATIKVVPGFLVLHLAFFSWLVRFLEVIGFLLWRLAPILGLIFEDNNLWCTDNTLSQLFANQGKPPGRARD